ncbi:hypothetical protein K4K59_010604 [Colletotrichum sp. SAR11_240]|nr:hypothetical protein K4K59_010604 [Colletotrichum sp. SAR11_240]
MPSIGETAASTASATTPDEPANDSNRTSRAPDLDQASDHDQVSDLDHSDPPVSASNSPSSKEVSGAESSGTDENDQRKYRVEKVTEHRWSETREVELLVHWGGSYSQDPPTWEPEATLWQDCRNVVLAYWSPNGVSTRTKKLELDKYNGPFTISQILKKKIVGNQRYYRVEWVGYRAATWEPIGGLPSEVVKA